MSPAEQRSSIFDSIAFIVVVLCALWPLLSGSLKNIHVAQSLQGIWSFNDMHLATIFRQDSDAPGLNRLFYTLIAKQISPQYLSIACIASTLVLLVTYIKTRIHSYKSACLSLNIVLLFGLMPAIFYMPLHVLTGLPLLMTYTVLSLLRKNMALFAAVPLLFLPAASTEASVLALLIAPLLIYRLWRHQELWPVLILAAVNALNLLYLWQSSVLTDMGTSSFYNNIVYVLPFLTHQMTPFFQFNIYQGLVLAVLLWLTLRAITARAILGYMRMHLHDMWLVIACIFIVSIAWLPKGSGLLATYAALLCYVTWLSLMPPAALLLQRVVGVVCIIAATASLGFNKHIQQRIADLSTQIQQQIAQTDALDAIYMLEPQQLYQHPHYYGMLPFVQSNVRAWLVQNKRFEAMPSGLFGAPAQRLWHDNPLLRVTGPMPWQAYPAALYNRRFPIIRAGAIINLPANIAQLYYPALTHSLPYEILLPKALSTVAKPAVAPVVAPAASAMPIKLPLLNPALSKKKH